MAQNTDVLIPSEHYTRADFTALRAWLNRLPLARIASLYYTEDDLEAVGCQTPEDLQQRLERLRDTLLQRATDSNPHAAEGLRAARRMHSWSKAAIDFIIRAADAGTSTPRKADPVSVWFRSRIAGILRAEGIRTLGDLMAFIEQRGEGWWKPLPRIGLGKATAVLRWLQQNAASLGPLAPPERLPAVIGETVLLAPERPLMVPLERIALDAPLDGSRGFNRHQGFSLISASNDLQAIDCYLYKFRHQEKTERAYRKELERFLLWCIYERAKPMSSVLTDDCEAYKDFLASPKPAWIGPKAKRLSPDWKPFAGIPSPASQRYAVQAIRSFFGWLVNVRYLAGNPWITVGDPQVARRLNPMQIDKALPNDLWLRLVADDGLLAAQAARPEDELRAHYRLRGAAAGISLAAQFRLVRAALLLLGAAGLRREEAAGATRNRLRPVAGVPDLWELDVLGKRHKWRTVFLPARAIAALQAHWADRGVDFSFAMSEIPLLSPLVTPPTEAGRRKHLDADGERKEAAFSPDGLYQVIKTALGRLAADESTPLDDGERAILARSGPHAFRHTFGTQAVAGEVPLDVLQLLLGHTSLQTTTIYVQAEKKRMIAEMGNYFRQA